MQCLEEGSEGKLGCLEGAAEPRRHVNSSRKVKVQGRILTPMVSSPGVSFMIMLHLVVRGTLQRKLSLLMC